MGRWRAQGVLILVSSLGAGCATLSPTYAPWPPTEPPLMELRATRTPLGEGEALRSTPLGEMEGASHHLIQLRGAEELHRHASHDLTVVVLEGEGVLDLEESGTLRRVPFRAGSVLVIPRGVAHAARSAGSAEVLAVAIFSPPLRGQDYVPAR